MWCNSSTTARTSMEAVALRVNLELDIIFCVVHIPGPCMVTGSAAGISHRRAQDTIAAGQGRQVFTDLEPDFAWCR